MLAGLKKKKVKNGKIVKKKKKSDRKWSYGWKKLEENEIVMRIYWVVCHTVNDLYVSHEIVGNFYIAC